MKTYLIIDTNGDGVGYFETSGNFFRNSNDQVALPDEVTEEEKQRIKLNPQHYSYRNGGIIEQSEEIKAQKDIALRNRGSKRERNPLLVRLEALEKTVKELEQRNK